MCYDVNKASTPGKRVMPKYLGLKRILTLAHASKNAIGVSELPQEAEKQIRGRNLFADGQSRPTRKAPHAMEFREEGRYLLVAGLGHV
jgi:hypothetical protein